LPAAAQTDDVFAGKSLAIVIGFGSGGATTSGAARWRAISDAPAGAAGSGAAEHAGRGSLNAANHLYAVAPRDGTAMGIIARDAVLAPLIGQKGARFDATKFSWIGSPDHGDQHLRRLSHRARTNVRPLLQQS